MQQPALNSREKYFEVGKKARISVDRFTLLICQAIIVLHKYA
jgi:hypothetical protein